MDKVWKLQDIVKDGSVSAEHEIALNALLKKVEDDYENLKLNTAISAFMIFIKKIKDDGWITKEELKSFLIALNPLAPHITSEVFERVFKHDILDEKFPEYDRQKTESDQIEIPVQVCGKLKCKVALQKGATQQQVLNAVKALNKLDIDFNNIKKVIYVPNKIINLIV